MKKMYGFIGMSVRVCAFVVALGFISVALTGCEFLNEFLGIGGGDDGTSGTEPEVPKPTEPMAEGGEPDFIKVAGGWYEVHTFRTEAATPLGEQAAYPLSFDWKPASGTVEVLVVAGGGGGGKGGTYSQDFTGSGGGAGRFVYHPAFKVGGGEEWETDGTITVKVGAGGRGNTTSGGDGGDGGNSEFSRSAAYKIIAPGGGGGAGNPNARKGRAGGSGGGSHLHYSGRSAEEPGTVPDGTDGVLNLGNEGHSFVGGGAGVYDMEDETAWGRGMESSISGESKWYAIGGAKGSPSPSTGIGAGSGGGGGSIGASGANPTNGNSGIVIVRWPYVASAP